MVGEILDNFLQKMQVAQQEFQSGKSIRHVLFSDNPGIVPKPKVIEKVQQKIYPIVKPSVVPKLLRTPAANISIPRANVSQVVPRAVVPQIVSKAKAVIPSRPVATDPLSTFARGFARVTGSKTSPPRGYHWIY